MASKNPPNNFMVFAPEELPPSDWWISGVNGIFQEQWVCPYTVWFADAKAPFLWLLIKRAPSFQSPSPELEGNVYTRQRHRENREDWRSSDCRLPKYGCSCNRELEMPQSLINPDHLCFHTGTHKPGSIAALQSVCSANLAVGAKGSTVFSGTGGKKGYWLFPSRMARVREEEPPKTGYLVSLP